MFAARRRHPPGRGRAGEFLALDVEVGKQSVEPARQPSGALAERLTAPWSPPPPIRLHDLRHGAATLAHAAGADLKDIQEMVGHSSITITADTYTSLFPEADRAIAEAAARLVPRARAASEEAAREAESEPDEAEESGPEPVPDTADPSGEISGPGDPSAHAPRTQTAPDEESEAE
ncbi:tyrosine-type recombinase/integrase [Streptomyces sp. NPDC050636]|uniref:tyrosine-type recombinase/integrase n=1 Tax=Streptomyces sp. NPDC050636 TaxID=3154510 RepID=UPI003432A4A3